MQPPATRSHRHVPSSKQKEKKHNPQQQRTGLQDRVQAWQLASVHPHRAWGAHRVEVGVQACLVSWATWGKAFHSLSFLNFKMGFPESLRKRALNSVKGCEPTRQPSAATPSSTVRPPASQRRRQTPLGPRYAPCAAPSMIPGRSRSWMLAPLY